MSNEVPAVVLCNGASDSMEVSSTESKTLELTYFDQDSRLNNVSIGLDKFVQNVFHLSDRVLDLVELAAYVYCADRIVGRGSTNSVEYHSWARSFHFVVRVRDHEFWQQSTVSESLANALKFMTGDREYRFEFQPGHSTPPTGLFDSENFHGVQLFKPSVVLFSGGLDSLAGTIELLESTEERVCLVSHQSQHGTIRTQNRLSQALREWYPGRVVHHTFRCNLSGARRREESQRTRAFLYTSIGFAIAQAFEQSRFLVYENGITSINFARREDVSNARASRTTHPKTIHLMQEFFSLFNDRPLQIQTPFLWKTKTDVVHDLFTGPHRELLPSAVSCSKTFRNLGEQTHCGGCSQCIDRRFAAYAAGAHEWDKTNIYAMDIISHSIPKGSRETKTTALDYVRQARNFGTWNIDHFYKELVSELSDLAGSFCYLPDCTNEIQAVEKVYCLCRRHGEQVEKAMNRMRQEHEDLYQKLADNSLLQLISDREYLNNPVERMVNSLMEIIRVAIPRMFSTTPPSNEADLNDKLGALLESHRSELRSEHPVISFAGGRTVPDHGSEKKDILIESKFIRSNTTPSKASEGIAADLTKYPSESHILFVVYDPQRRIMNDDQFRGDFESQGGCTVLIIR